MKAAEFIAKFGWEKVRDGVRNIKPYEDYLVGIYNSNPKEIDGVVCIDRTPCKADVDDLKRYVDAWELIKDHYSLTRAKKYAESAYTAPEIAEPLKKAIALVEEVESLKDVC